MCKIPGRPRPGAIEGLGLGRVHHYYETRQRNDAVVTCEGLTLGGGLGRVHHYYETRQHNDAPFTYQRLTLTQHSVYYFAPRVWNALPKQIRDAPSLSIFKKHMKLPILGRYQMERKEKKKCLFKLKAFYILYT